MKLVDQDHTFQLDLNLLESAITPATKCIIVIVQTLTMLLGMETTKVFGCEVYLQHLYAEFHRDKVVEFSATSIAPYQYTLSPSSAYP
eukprot:gene10689-22308_t